MHFTAGITILLRDLSYETLYSKDRFSSNALGHFVLHRKLTNILEHGAQSVISLTS